MHRRVLLVGLLVAGYLVARLLWQGDVDPLRFEAQRPSGAELDAAVAQLDGRDPGSGTASPLVAPPPEPSWTAGVAARQGSSRASGLQSTPRPAPPAPTEPPRAGASAGTTAGETTPTGGLPDGGEEPPPSTLPPAATQPLATAQPPEPSATVTPLPSSTPTADPTATPTASLPAPTATATPIPTSTVPSGGTKSPEPAGDWVTSTHPSASYYTTRENEARWREWSPENRIWFQTEGELLAAYPGRTLDAPDPTATPTVAPSATERPTVTPAATVIPSSTPAPDPTASPSPSATEVVASPTATDTPPAPTSTPTPSPSSEGVRSPDPAGEWVTSVDSGCRHYCSSASSYWLSWLPGSRIWFPSEASLLAAYPGRTRR